MTETPKLAVGSTIWYFDINHRVYQPVPRGKAWARSISGPPIYREQWRPVEITGENRRSWITSYGKVPKTGEHQGWVLSLAELEEDCWKREHLNRIVNALWGCRDVAVIRQVAALIGYTPDGK